MLWVLLNTEVVVADAMLGREMLSLGGTHAAQWC